jgi:flagellar hook-associated protein FlgK
MPLQFADRLNNVETSAIRELFKLLGKPGIISFAGGFPDSAMFDVQGIREASNAALEQDKAQLLQQIDNWTAQIKDLAAENAAAEEALSSTPTQLQQARGALQQALQRASDADDANAAAARQIKDLQGQVQALSQAAAEAAGEVEATRAREAAARAEAERLRRDLDAASEVRFPVLFTIAGLCCLLTPLSTCRS